MIRYNRAIVHNLFSSLEAIFHTSLPGQWSEWIRWTWKSRKHPELILPVSLRLSLIPSADTNQIFAIRAWFNQYFLIPYISYIHIHLILGSENMCRHHFIPVVSTSFWHGEIFRNGWNENILSIISYFLAFSVNYISLLEEGSKSTK